MEPENGRPRAGEARKQVRSNHESAVSEFAGEMTWSWIWRMPTVVMRVVPHRARASWVPDHRSNVA